MKNYHTAGLGWKNLYISTTFDFIFLKQITKPLRWLLVLPMGFLTILLTQATLNLIAQIILILTHYNDIVALLSAGIMWAVQYALAIVVMTATAPVTSKKKFKWGLFLSCILWLLAASSTYLIFKSLNAQFVISRLLCISLSAAIGLSYGLYLINKRINQHKDFYIKS
ncbi:hypothetical protein [Alloprevotella tannerae]|uniref:hypothetical protein n=1 Tax=Alloprevotella tannerae TaxID=76122 RepID=UPI0028E484D6|nr:hypothetical protein [Alloprevotella tannerae]